MTQYLTNQISFDEIATLDTLSLAQAAVLDLQLTLGNVAIFEIRLEAICEQPSYKQLRHEVKKGNILTKRSKSDSVDIVDADSCVARLLANRGHRKAEDGKDANLEILRRLRPYSFARALQFYANYSREAANASSLTPELERELAKIIKKIFEETPSIPQIDVLQDSRIIKYLNQYLNTTPEAGQAARQKSFLRRYIAPHQPEHRSKRGRKKINNSQGNSQQVSSRPENGLAVSTI